MGRQAHGDLTGAFGAISAGRQYSLGFNNLATIDPFGTGFAGQANNVSAAGLYLVDPSGIRLNNSVIYSTPSIGGWFHGLGLKPPSATCHGKCVQWTSPSPRAECGRWACRRWSIG
jgi:predicted porin